MKEPILKLLELDRRHNELLDRIAVLDQEVDAVLSEWTSLKRSHHNGLDENHLPSVHEIALEPGANQPNAVEDFQDAA